jgi:lysyl-tRNA synthetase class I
MKEKLVLFLIKKFAPTWKSRMTLLNAGIQDMPEIARKEVIGYLIAQNMPTHHVHQNPRKKAA